MWRVPQGCWYLQLTRNLARTNFDVIFGQEKQVLSASSSWCGRALYHRVHNHESPLKAESQQSVQTLIQKTPPLSGFFGNLLTNSQSRLESRVILLTVVSSLFTEARLYEFSRRLVYYLWYTLANSPIVFWNRLNPTFTMAGHFF